MYMYAVEAIKRDFVANKLRSEDNDLELALEIIEEEHKVNCDHIRESLRDIEEKFCRYRKLCLSN